jgi:hypothetical protein
MDGTMNSVHIVPMIMPLTSISSSVYRGVRSVHSPALYHCYRHLYIAVL